jgi:hypothetical protein
MTIPCLFKTIQHKYFAAPGELWSRNVLNLVGERLVPAYELWRGPLRVGAWRTPEERGRWALELARRQVMRS